MTTRALRRHLRQDEGGYVDEVVFGSRVAALLVALGEEVVQVLVGECAQGLEDEGCVGLLKCGVAMS